MAVSATSVIHYTRSFENLKGILSNGFRVYYCIEEIFQVQGAHPMVSFCDLPLTSSKDHFVKYGDYGIALHKRWAVKNELNPVLYLNPFSSICEMIWGQLHRYNSVTETEDGEKVVADLLNMLCFVKEFQGELRRPGMEPYKYIFYNEREWRYVPKKILLRGFSNAISADEYLSKKEFYNKKLSHLRLKFDPTDITYIILKDRNEISKLSRYLRKIYSKKCSPVQFDLLMSKILTTGQILDDF